MDKRKLVMQQTGIIALGEAVGAVLICGVYALLGYFDKTVLAGSLLGGLLATLNFFFMAVSTCNAAEKAAEQDVKGGKSLVQFSYIIRMAALFILLVALAKSGLCDPIALVLPLVFVRITITVAEFFRKPEEK